MKICYDQLETAGSHGSGSINAIQSGIYPMFLSKDGKKLYVKRIKRPWTREVVGDETGEFKTRDDDTPQEVEVEIQTAMQRKALNIIMRDKAERFLETWSDKTVLVEQGDMTPAEFYKMEMERRRKQN